MLRDSYSMYTFDHVYLPEPKGHVPECATANDCMLEVNFPEQPSTDKRRNRALTAREVHQLGNLTAVP